MMGMNNELRSLATSGLVNDSVLVRRQTENYVPVSMSSIRGFDLGGESVQWHDLKPMFIKTNLFSFFALCIVSSSRICHAMGEEACDRTYGLVLWAARFSSGGRLEIDVCDSCADSSASRFEAAEEPPCSWDFIIVSALEWCGSWTTRFGSWSCAVVGVAQGAFRALGRGQEQRGGPPRAFGGVRHAKCEE